MLSVLPKWQEEWLTTQSDMVPDAVGRIQELVSTVCSAQHSLKGVVERKSSERAGRLRKR